MPVQNLTKENFWNDMQEKYPAAMKLFCAWIDGYKKENNWAVLFNSDSNWQDADGKNAPAPKYHDLPLAMQFGIWLEFMINYYAETDETVFFDTEVAFSFKMASNRIKDWLEFINDNETKNQQ